MTQAELIEYDKRTIRAHEPYQIIIRAIHERGERQTLALAELKRRGLWLTAEQRRQADLD